jgi:hypothetical protein
MLFLQSGKAVTGDDSGQLTIWTHRCLVGRLEGLRGKILRIVSMQGMVFAAAVGGDVGIWNASDGKLLAVVPTERDLGALVDLFVDLRDGRCLVACVGVDGRIGVWDVPGKVWLWRVGSRRDVYGTVGVCGGFLVCVDVRGYVGLYDWERGLFDVRERWKQKVQMMVGVGKVVVSVLFSGRVEVQRILDDGNMIVLGCLARRGHYDVEKVVSGDGKDVVFVLRGSDGYMVELWGVQDMVRQAEGCEVVLW